MSSVGRYEIHGEIASGGMARVHYGRLRGDEGFQRVVAIKRMHPKLARDPKFVAMFRDEALLASRIRHPNVVPTLDVVSTGTDVVIVMEYVRGLPLSTLLARTTRAGDPVPVAIAVTILTDVLAGLHAAHEARGADGAALSIVHRDVSPQNILVDVDGVARVMDFGIAKASSQLHITMEGEIKGKLAFMAPEQLLSRPVDRRTDVFAAGVVLHSMLIGRSLFAKGEVDDVRERVLSMPIEPVVALRPEVGQAISDVIAKALARDPAERHATARDFEVALEAACERPATARQLGAWVEHLGSEALRERDLRISTIEASDKGASADASTAAASPAHDVTATDAPTVDLLEVVPAAASKEDETTGPSVVSDVTPARRIAPRLLIAGVAASAALAIGLWLSRPQAEVPGRSASGAPVVASAATASAQVPAPAEVASPGPAPDSAVPVASTELSALSVSASASARRKLPGYFPARP